jgi:hypothetical protein
MKTLTTAGLILGLTIGLAHATMYPLTPTPRTVNRENFYIGLFVCLTAQVNYHWQYESAQFQP